MDNTKCMQSYVRKTSFSVLIHFNSVSVPAHEKKTKIKIFASIFIFDSAVSQKNGSFRYHSSFACSIFSKSWEVTNYGFLGVAHLPLSRGGALRCGADLGFKNSTMIGPITLPAYLHP